MHRFIIILFSIVFLYSCNKQREQKDIPKSEMSLKQATAEMKNLVERDKFEEFFGEWVKVDVNDDFDEETLQKDLKQVKAIKGNIVSFLNHAHDIFPTNDAKLEKDSSGKVQVFHSNLRMTFKNYHGSWMIDEMGVENIKEKMERLHNREQDDFPTY